MRILHKHVKYTFTCVFKGFLDWDTKIYAACDLRTIQSPGAKMYPMLKVYNGFEDRFVPLKRV